jgi:hypothetical protein
MREFQVRFTIRTILRPRFATSQRVRARLFREAVDHIRALYGPRLLEISEVIETTGEA